MQRYWINQPATKQVAHTMHGLNVLTDMVGDKTVTVYFVSGRIISAVIPKNALSEGWT
jgi:hypothetical protein